MEKVYVLKARTELRFDVTSESDGISIQLRKGSCEIFGCPLTSSIKYNMPVGHFAVFSWYDDSEIALYGNCPNAYTSEDTGNMINIVNIHGVLENQRERAFADAAAAAATASSNGNISSSSSAAASSTAAVADGSSSSSSGMHSLSLPPPLSMNSSKHQVFGPRVLICGPPDSGKSTVAKTLLAYAVRRERRPMFVDLDVEQGNISIPGTISCGTIDSIKNISVQEGPLVSSPFTLFVGDDNIHISHPEFYRRQITKIVEVIEHRLQVDTVARSSGLIVNTSGWIEKLGYDLLLYTIQTAKIDSVIVIGDERLMNNLKRDVGSAPSPKSAGMWAGVHAFFKVVQSGGVNRRSSENRSVLRDIQIRKYFYGTPISGELSPAVITIGFDDVVILRLADEEAAADISMLPMGSENIDPVQLRVVKPTIQDLKHTILSVSYAQEESLVLKSNIAGFLHVREVNENTKTISVLAPSAGALPGRYLLLGSVKLVEFS